MEFVGFQLGISLTAVIVCIIFLMAFSMKSKSQNISKSKKKESLKEMLSQPSMINSRPSQPLSFLDPHQPNNMKKQFNYG